MEPIDYTEKIAGETLKELREAYEALHERALKFVTLMGGAAGALATYAIGRIGTDYWIWQTLPLGSLAIWLFFVSGLLLIWGMTTKNMLAGPSAKAVRGMLIKNTPKSPEGEGDRASFHKRSLESVETTRWNFTSSIDQQISKYRKGGHSRGLALDVSYLLAVLGSPAAIGFGLWLAWRHPPPWL